jgi:DHA1 family bicyclomycin/chloramphenicol resistance-like MFS transporter
MYSQQQLTLSRFFLVFVAGLAALGPLSIDAYLPTLPDLAQEFGVSMSTANLTVSAFFFGMALGQFIGGPLSDQLGRKKIGLVGLVIHIIATVAITFAVTLDQILVLRLVQAIGGGFASVICLAQVRDIFEPADVGPKFANIIIVILIAPMLAPALGTVISAFGWRAIFLALAVYGVLMMVLYIALVPETNQDMPEQFSVPELFKGYWAAVTKRTDGRLIGLRLALFSGLSAGVLFCYVTNAAFILIDFFKLSKVQFSIAFGMMILTFMIGNRISVRLMKVWAAPKIVDRINLIQLLVTLIMIVLCFFIELTLWQVLLGISLILGCHGATSPAASGYFIGLYDKNVGSASSLSSTLVFAFGGLIGGASSLLSQGKLLPIFLVMFGASFLARICLKTARIS